MGCGWVANVCDAENEIKINSISVSPNNRNQNKLTKTQNNKDYPPDFDEGILGNGNKVSFRRYISNKRGNPG